MRRPAFTTDSVFECVWPPIPEPRHQHDEASLLRSVGLCNICLWTVVYNFGVVLIAILVFIVANGHCCGRVSFIVFRGRMSRLFSAAYEGIVDGGRQELRLAWAPFVQILWKFGLLPC